MTAGRKLVLYDWKPSPFCMKVRAVLAHKGLAYETRPALRHIKDLYRRGGIGKVPALELGDEFLIDSTDICHRLEREFPERPVLPSDPRERAQCHVFEELCDESLYFFGLYYHWHEPEGRRRAAKYFARTLLGRLFFRPFLGRVERQLQGHGLGRKTPAHVRADLERNLEAFDTLLEGRDYLLGHGPHLCDFALASHLDYLILAPATRDALASRPNLRRLLERCPSDLKR